MGKMGEKVRETVLILAEGPLVLAHLHTCAWATVCGPNTSAHKARRFASLVLWFARTHLS